jgi:SAM-dependent methyltransferase
MLRRVPTAWVVRPYSHIAPDYDLAVGIRDFVRTRNAFEGLMRRYGIRFQSAADLGCGTGLFACYLSRCWNVPVFAVDCSPEMLKVAAYNCRDARLCLLLQDIRRLRLPCRVDLATANTYTLNHFLDPSEMKAAFRRIRENLRPGGHLIFDIVTHRQSLSASRVYVRRFRARGREFAHELRWNPARGLLSILIVHRALAPAPLVEVYVGRGYSPLDVALWLRETGFEIRGIHDAATLRVASGSPPHVVVVARSISA